MMLLELAPAALVERMNRAVGDLCEDSDSPLQSGALYGQTGVGLSDQDENTSHLNLSRTADTTMESTSADSGIQDGSNDGFAAENESLVPVLDPSEATPSKSTSAKEQNMDESSSGVEGASSDVLLVRIRRRQRQYAPTEEEIANYRLKYDVVTSHTVRLNWVLSELLLPETNDETEESMNKIYLLETELSLLLAYTPETNIKRAQVFPNGYLSQIILDNYDALVTFSTQYPNLHLASKAIRYLVTLIYNVNYWEVYHLLYIVPKISYFMELLKFEIVDTPFGPLVRPPKDYVEDKMLSGLQYPFPYPFYNFSYHSFNPVGHISKLKRIHIEPYIDIRLQSSDSGAQHHDVVEDHIEVGSRGKRRKVSSTRRSSRKSAASKIPVYDEPEPVKKTKRDHSATEAKYYLYYGLNIDENEPPLTVKEKKLMELIPEYLRPLKVFGNDPVLITKVQAEAQIRQKKQEQERIRHLPPVTTEDIVALSVIPVGPEIVPEAQMDGREKAKNEVNLIGLDQEKAEEQEKEEEEEEADDDDNSKLIPRMVGKQVVLVDNLLNTTTTTTTTAAAAATNPVGKSTSRRRKERPEVPTEVKTAVESVGASQPDSISQEQAVSALENQPRGLPMAAHNPQSGSQVPIPISTPINVYPSNMVPLQVAPSQVIISPPEIPPAMMTSTIGGSKPAFEISKRMSRIDPISYANAGESTITDINAASSATNTNQPGGTTHQCFLTDPSTLQPCLKRFYGKNELMRHQEFVHATQKKIYRCIYCLKNNAVVQCYPRHDSLARHIRKKHGVTGRENKIAVNYAKANVEIIDEPLNAVLAKGKSQMVLHDESEDELDTEKASKGSLKLPQKDKTTSESVPTEGALLPGKAAAGSLSSQESTDNQIPGVGADDIKKEADVETGSRIKLAPVNIYSNTAIPSLANSVGIMAGDQTNRNPLNPLYPLLAQSETHVVLGATPSLRNTLATPLAPIGSIQPSPQQITGAGTNATANANANANATATATAGTNTTGSVSLGGIPPIRPNLPAAGQAIGFQYPPQQYYVRPGLPGDQTQYVQHPILVSPNAMYSQAYPYYLPMNALQPAAYSPPLTNKYGYPYLGGGGATNAAGVAGGGSPGPTTTNGVPGTLNVSSSESASGQTTATSGGGVGLYGATSAGTSANSTTTVAGAGAGAGAGAAGAVGASTASSSSPYNFGHHVIQGPLPPQPQPYQVQYFTGAANTPGQQFMFYHPMGAPGITPATPGMPLVHQLPQMNHISPPPQHQGALPYGAGVGTGVFGAPLPRPPQPSDRRQ